MAIEGEVVTAMQYAYNLYCVDMHLSRFSLDVDIDQVTVKLFCSRIRCAVLSAKYWGAPQELAHSVRK